MEMRAGYTQETIMHIELESVKAILVFNYVLYNKPCEIISHVTNFIPNKEFSSNALGIWKVKLKPTLINDNNYDTKRKSERIDLQSWY